MQIIPNYIAKIRVGRSVVVVVFLAVVLFSSSVLAATNPIYRASTDSANTESNGASVNRMSISKDGRYIAFASSATNLVASDTNGVADVFRKDTTTGTIIRVSTGTGGTQLAAGSGITTGGMST